MLPVRMLALVVSATSLFAVAAAPAAVITERFVFTATDFISNDGVTPGPVGKAGGSITIRFDPALGYDNTSAGLTVEGIVPFDLSASPVGFSYFPQYFNGDLTIGGIGDSITGGIQVGTADFVLTILNVKTDPTFSSLVYTRPDYTGAAHAQNGTVVAGPVPEPTLLALGPVAAALLRRRRSC